MVTWKVEDTCVERGHLTCLCHQSHGAGGTTTEQVSDDEMAERKTEWFMHYEEGELEMQGW